MCEPPALSGEELRASAVDLGAVDEEHEDDLRQCCHHGEDKIRCRTEADRKGIDHDGVVITRAQFSLRFLDTVCYGDAYNSLIPRRLFGQGSCGGFVSVDHQDRQWNLARSLHAWRVGRGSRFRYSRNDTGGLREGWPVPLLERLIPGAACPGDAGGRRDAAMIALAHRRGDAMGWDDFHLHQFDVLDDTKDESRVTLARLRRRRRRLSPRRLTPRR